MIRTALTHLLAGLFVVLILAVMIPLSLLFGWRDERIDA